MDNNITIEKWQGIKNTETKQTVQGYLFIRFLSDTAIINTNPNVIDAKENQYQAGKCIGFPIQNVSNKREAILKFLSTYKITKMTKDQQLKQEDINLVNAMDKEAENKNKIPSAIEMAEKAIKDHPELFKNCLDTQLVMLKIMGEYRRKCSEYTNRE